MTTKTSTSFLFIKIFFIGLFILSALVIAYHEVLNNQFIESWDTGSYITHNENIRALTWANIQWMLTTFHVGNWHPLTWLSHAFDYALFGLDPWGHHLTNLIFHGLNAILLLILAMVLIATIRSKENIFRLTAIDAQTLLAATMVAFLFAVHPQHVESVAWVAERKNVLSQFFILLTLLSYVFYVQSKTVKGQFYWYGFSVVSFIFALLSKPMAVTVPALLLLLDIYPLHRTSLTFHAAKTNTAYRQLILEKIPFFIFTLAVIILTVLAQHQGQAIANVEQVNFQIRVINAFNSLILYLSKFLLPLNLSPFYPFTSIRNFSQYYLSLVPVITGILITLVCGYFWFKKQYYWLTAWLFYLIALSPVIGIIQVGGQAAADRYVYLPILPIYFLVGIGIAHIYYNQRTPFKRFLQLAILIGGVIIGGSLIHLTQKQTFIWKNELIFWNYLVLQEPYDAFLRVRLVKVYFKYGYYDRGFAHYQRAAELNPQAYSGLALAYIERGQLLEALNVYQYVIKNNLNIGQSQADIYYNIGWIDLQQEQLPEAQKNLEQALALEPQHELAQKLLPTVISLQNSTQGTL